MLGPIIFANIIPDDISRLALAGEHSSELETLRALKSSLPNAYAVFHGVHWTREYRGWTHFDEIDFVVLNQSDEALFIVECCSPASTGRWPCA